MKDERCGESEGETRAQAGGNGMLVFFKVQPPHHNHWILDAACQGSSCVILWCRRTIQGFTPQLHIHLSLTSSLVPLVVCSPSNTAPVLLLPSSSPCCMAAGEESAAFACFWLPEGSLCTRPCTRPSVDLSLSLARLHLSLSPLMDHIFLSHPVYYLRLWDLIRNCSIRTKQHISSHTLNIQVVVQQ